MSRELVAWGIINQVLQAYDPLWKPFSCDKELNLWVWKEIKDSEFQHFLNLDAGINKPLEWVKSFEFDFEMNGYVCVFKFNDLYYKLLTQNNSYGDYNVQDLRLWEVKPKEQVVMIYE